MKPIKKKKLFIISILLLSVFVANAQTKLASIFQDHMVLQRNTSVSIWGTDTPNTKITVSGSWGAEAITVTQANGCWKTTLKTSHAGGPFFVKIDGTTTRILKNILLGEVWICSGQSNMAMPLKGGAGQHIEGSLETIVNSKNTQIRLLTVKRNPSFLPVDSITGTWQEANSKTTAEFSAVGYAFGQRLHQVLGVPIGLISTNVGGTPAQAWTPKETVIRQFPEFQKDFEKDLTTKRASVLYNGMVHPLIPYTIKGVIWYQGEGNRWNPKQYASLFPAMIKSWRTQWQQGDFPFYFVQIAPFGKNIKGWVGVQEAQLQTMMTLNNTGMAVINDIGYQSRIHPPQKLPVGHRLALWALAKDYGIEGIDYSGPVYQSMKVEHGKALLTFDYAPLGLTSMGKPLNHFEVLDAEGKYHSAQAKIINKGSVLQVWSDEVQNPVGVRYGWKSYIDGCLFNTASLPASCFDTSHKQVFGHP
ncbi:sialate O-acetylesterase [Ochrovirga pacifica]|uniref:sialate O-acetylesterase n=1 Tax=Ochrovirga pacifica TaxID=1042376 RepID=UPI00025594F7|nr:sialate O-acetylesterase [Ochrovirga pacifica]